MARIVAKVQGGSLKELIATTVGEVKASLSATTHTATVNKEPADNSYVLSDDDLVMLAPSVKGARWIVRGSKAIRIA